jgi:hypothetical protein
MIQVNAPCAPTSVVPFGPASPSLIQVKFQERLSTAAIASRNQEES